MADVEQRLAYLEHRAKEHEQSMDGIRDAVQNLEARIDARLTAFEVRVDQRFAAIDLRFLGIDQRLDAMDGKFTRYFTWTIGLHITGLVAVIAVLVAALAAR